MIDMKFLIVVAVLVVVAGWAVGEHFVEKWATRKWRAAWRGGAK